MRLIYITVFQSYGDTQDTDTFKIFQVTIGNSKCVGNFKFHNDSPMLKYHQKPLNSCCFSSLASSFASIEQTETTNAILLRIEESLNRKVVNFIDSANAVFKTEKKLQANQECIIA